MSGPRQTVVCQSLLLVVSVSILASAPSLAADFFETRPQDRLQTVVPGEFEPQQGVLLGWDPDDEVVQQALVEIIRAIQHRVPVILLAADAEVAADAAQALSQSGIDPAGIEVLQIPIDTIWTRDYGPVIIRDSHGLPLILDSEYPHANRGNDDLLPTELSRYYQLPSKHVALAVDGGNILSNGKGLLVATDALLEHNLARGYRKREIERILKEAFGAREIVYLERLVGEDSGHIDMFATFTAPDTIVVGQYAPEFDEVNAEILDRNAGRLASLDTPHGPMRVERIPMGPRDFEVWRTYTNVLFANGALLMPVYPGLDWIGEKQSRELYQRLLPGWEVIPINCTPLIEWGGAIHCVTRNLPDLSAGREALNSRRPVDDEFEADVSFRRHRRYARVDNRYARPPATRLPHYSVFRHRP